MGLDMYLHARKQMPRVDAIKLTEEANAGKEPWDHPYPSYRNEEKWAKDAQEVLVTAEAAYWRKANAIHGWFVDNVQGGEDECNPFPVTAKQLQELSTVCEKALAAKEPIDELEPRGGFFFGPTDDNEWFLEYCQGTIDNIKTVLEKFPEADGWKYEYQSSW